MKEKEKHDWTCMVCRSDSGYIIVIDGDAVYNECDCCSVHFSDHESFNFYRFE